MTDERATALLKAACIANIAIGLACVGLSVLAPDALAALLKWVADSGVAVGEGAGSRLGIVIAGGVMVGWGTTVLMNLRGWSILRATGLGILAWYAVDSGGSIAVGFSANAVANLAFVVLFLPAVIAVFRGAQD